MESKKDLIPLDLIAIKPGLFCKIQIRKYIKYGWLIQRPDGDRDLEKCLKAATYDIRLGNIAARYEKGRRRIYLLGDTKNHNAGIDTELVLEPNSLTFVSTYEKFRLPDDIVARFNLKVKYVHKGLLLGTGPIVDPGYRAGLMIPIHNFSDHAVIIPYRTPFIAVEFTKTLLDEPYNKEDMKNSNPGMSFEDYLDKAGYVESSVYRGLKVTNEKVENFERKLNRYEFIAILGTLGATLGILAIIIALYIGLNNRLDSLNNIIENTVRQYIQKK